MADRLNKKLWRRRIVDMKTLVLETPGSLKWVDVADPFPGGEALVRVRRCVCVHRHSRDGVATILQLPRRLGHELCVEVISADSAI